jgi:hypothetical protein
MVTEYTMNIVNVGKRNTLLALNWLILLLFILTTDIEFPLLIRWFTG